MNFLFLPFLVLSAFSANETDVAELPPVVVQETFSPGPGAAPRVRTAREATASRDVHEVLSSTPGVVIQGEDGLGLRPNISLRGVAPHRSRKVTLLEDGLLIGPAPYSAPAAYYTPSLVRTRGLDVLRGFRAVPYGPNTVGGAVDYLTERIGPEDSRELKFLGGSHGTSGVQGRWDGRWSESGLLVLLDHVQSDGFKSLPNGGGTGFAKNDLFLKYEWSPVSLPDHSFEVKVGLADEVSDETYLGLTTGDFNSAPFGRYAASEGDVMKWRHQQLDLGHRWARDDGEWRVRLYHRAFWRNWRRFNGFMDSSRDVSEILRNPDFGNAVYADILRGRQDSSVLGGGGGELDVVLNERRYSSTGALIERRWQLVTERGDLDLRVGILHHADDIERDHRRDVSVIENGRRVSTGRSLEALTRDRQRAQAQVGRGELRWRLLDWTLAASLRHENVSYDGRNGLTGTSSSSSEWATLPGVGLSREWSRVELFTTISRGVTMRGPEASSTQERSITTEIGARGTSSDSPWEVVAFETLYDRLKGVCSFSSGCTQNSRLDESASGGRARIQGLETSGALVVVALGERLELRGSWTRLEAVFQDRFTSDLPEWGVGNIEPGDPLPYVPRDQYSLGASWLRARWTATFGLRHQSAMQDQSVQTNRREIPAHSVIDGGFSWRIGKGRELSFKGENLLDNAYLISYRPFGARPGKPRTFSAGLSWKF